MEWRMVYSLYDEDDDQDDADANADAQKASRSGFFFILEKKRSVES